MSDLPDDDPVGRAAIFDAHVHAEFVDRDVAATMRTMTAEPYLDHVPVMTGGRGRAEVERFYAEHFIGQWPADTRIVPISRTIGESRVIDEFIVCFTHDCEMDAILPGVPPTGRPVEVPTVVVMGFEGDRIAYEHIYWDQASVLVQIGLLDPAGLPVAGVEQAHKLVAPRERPSNTLIARWAAAEPPAA